MSAVFLFTLQLAWIIHGKKFTESLNSERELDYDNDDDDDVLLMIILFYFVYLQANW